MKLYNKMTILLRRWWREFRTGWRIARAWPRGVLYDEWDSGVG